MLRIEQAGVGGQTRQFSRATRWSLHDKPPVIEQQGAQPGKLFAAAGSSRAAVQAARHNVAMPGILGADAGVNNHDAPMKIADAEHDSLKKCGIIRKNRSNE